MVSFFFLIFLYCFYFFLFPFLVTISPLEVTHKLLFTEKESKRIKQLNSNFSLLMLGLFNFFRKNYYEVFFMENPPVHDPSVVAYVIVNKNKFFKFF